MSSARSFFFMQIKVIFIRMVSHLASLWNRGTRELGNGLSSARVQNVESRNFRYICSYYIAMNSTIFALCKPKWDNRLEDAEVVVNNKSSVFMWRNHIPKWNITFPSEVLVLSEKRPYRKLTFHNVLAWQGSSYCNRARLIFQAFALRDMKIATREGSRVGQKMSYHFSFC